MVKTLLFNDTLFNQFDNNKILNATITFLVSLKRSDGNIFYSDYAERKRARSNTIQEFKTLF